MITTSGAGLDQLRARVAGAIGGRMAGDIERLGWSAPGWRNCSARGCGRC
jgi:hypothetical protein